MSADAIDLVTPSGVTVIPGMPPGQGEAAVPHSLMFLGLYAGGSAKVFYPSDEALRQSRDHARFMLLDPTIMECVELRQRATALLDWRIEADRNDPQTQQQAHLLTRILRRVPRFVQYREVLMKAIWYGRYAMENVFAWDWIDGQKLVTINGWHPIHGDKLVWKIDSTTGRWEESLWGIRIGRLAGWPAEHQRWYDRYRQYVESTEWGWAFFPPPGLRETILIHRHQIEDGEYEEPRAADRVFGIGIRHRIYWIWYQKQEALRWLMEFLERSAFGIEIWFYPAGNLEARKEFLEAATQRVGTGKNILLVPRPPGMEGAVYGVERIEPSMAGAQALKEILTEYFGHQIKRYVLGQTLTTEAHATGLGSNLASIHLDTFLQIIRYDASNLEETLTDQLVQRLARWNWPGVDAKQFRFRIELDKPDVAERLQAIRAAYEMGLRIRAADLRDLLGIAQPGPQEETLQHPALAPQTPPQAPPDLMPPENPSPEQSYYQSDPWQHYQAKKKHFEGEIRQEPNTRHLQILHKGRWHNLPEEHPGGPEGQSPPAGRPEGQKSHSLFVSPNVAEGLTIEQALKALKSPQHQIAKKQYEDIVNRYRALMSQNFRCQLHDSVGDWSDGAENSLHLEIWNADPILLKVMAAEMGLVSDPPQKAVAFFYPQPNGADIRWRSVLSENLEKIRMELDRVGLQYRTLIPHENAWEIIICGDNEELWNKIKKLPDFFTKSASYQVGHFKYFGDEDRQKAGELYRRIIERFWQQIEKRREKMAAQNLPEDDDQWGDLWFLEEKPTWDSKTRAIARIIRTQYERELLSPEEKAARKERCRKLEEELRARGMRREDEKDDPQGSIFT